MDMSMFTGLLFEWLRTGIFWLVLIFVLAVAVFGTLIIRKNKKLQYVVLEITNLGSGKIGVNSSKAGWFKTNTILFGLWDQGGEDILKLKDGRKVQCASSVDFHEINGKRGLIVKRKDDDPKILVPLTSIEISNKHLLSEIAPADMRDASVNIIRQAEKEASTFLDKYLPYIMLGGVVVFAFVSIILIIQMVKNGQTEAGDLILQAGKQACDIQQQVISSSAP